MYQTREWVDFVSETQRADPVVAAVVDGGDTVGYFTGLMVKRYGLRILGSPMPGWTTTHMGFNLDQGVSRRLAAEALLRFAFGELRCAHIELRDRGLGYEDIEGLGFSATHWHGLETDLTGTEEDVFGRMKGPVRTAVRKAARKGVVVEVADDLDFADDFYPQLVDVFAKQSLSPPYGVDRIRALIRDVHPSGRLLLLRARDAGGKCVATGIFPATNRTMHFLAGASWREHQHLRPNEAVMWHAMRYWMSRGIEVCDLGGFLPYKRKYGVNDVHLPFLRKSRSRPVAGLREAARSLFVARQRLRGRVGRHRGSPSTQAGREL